MQQMYKSIEGPTGFIISSDGSSDCVPDLSLKLAMFPWRRRFILHRKIQQQSFIGPPHPVLELVHKRVSNQGSMNRLSTWPVTHTHLVLLLILQSFSRQLLHSQTIRETRPRG